MKTTPAGVTSWNLDTGKEGWSTPYVNNSCLASTNALDGKIVVQSGKRCDTITALDLKDGSKLWSAELKAAQDSQYEFDGTQIAISGNTVAVAWMYGSATYDLTTGASIVRTRARSSRSGEARSGTVRCRP